MEQIYTIPVNEAFDEVGEKKECGCPFCTLYRRLQNDEIEIVVGQTRKNDEEPRVLAFDGNGKIELQPGDKIKVSTAEEATKIIKIDEVSFLQSVRNKLK